MKEEIGLSRLLTELEFPPEAARAIQFWDSALPPLEEAVQKCKTPGQGEEGLRLLAQALPEDEWGLQTLTVMLRSALLTREDYRQRGMEDSVFVATMKGFARYEREHEVSYGRIGFDRAFWATRHLSMLIFRLGEFEFQLSQPEGVVHLHIPSDCRLSLAALRRSVEQALDFFARYAPAYAHPAILCESWMLSPALPALLPESSHLLQFQRAFDVYATDPDALDYLEWVYQLGRKQQPAAELRRLPEGTTLQRNMKRYLLEGGQVGIAWGRLRLKG